MLEKCRRGKSVNVWRGGSKSSARSSRWKKCGGGRSDRVLDFFFNIF